MFVLNAYFLRFLTYIRPSVEINPVGKAISKLVCVQTVPSLFLRISGVLQEHLALDYAFFLAQREAL